jgi:hypothetical protein
MLLGGRGKFTWNDVCFLYSGINNQSKHILEKFLSKVMTYVYNLEIDGI